MKKDQTGAIVKYKARLVAKGYSQKFGIDYEEIYALVAIFDSIRILIAIAAQLNWKLHQLDVKSAFLNGVIAEDLYVMQPEGYVKKGHESYVLKLTKALYGLKQAPRVWNSKLNKTMDDLGFKRSRLDTALYYKGSEEEKVLVGIYVDDVIITGPSGNQISKFKEEMKDKFEMTDLGLLNSYLGMEVRKSSANIFLSQRAYTNHILKVFKMNDCNAIKTPMDVHIKLQREAEGKLVNSANFRSLIGSLRYHMNTRPDITYSVSYLSRFVDKPSSEHLVAAKRILRYLKGTVNFRILYKRGDRDMKITGYSDSDFAGGINDRKSTSCQIFFLGGLPITWNSVKQRVVALSTCEAEYIAVSSATCQSLCISRLVKELMSVEENLVKILVDNKSALELTRNPVHHSRSKHIDTRHHFIRDCIEEGFIKLEYVRTEDQLADLFTKSLGRVKFYEFCAKIGVSIVGTVAD